MTGSKRLEAFARSVRLDDARSGLIADRERRRLTERDGLKGWRGGRRIRRFAPRVSLSARVGAVLLAGESGERVAAVADPGSPLEARAVDAALDGLGEE